MKNILVQFDIKAGEYEHRDFYLFKKKQSLYFRIIVNYMLFKMFCF